MIRFRLPGFIILPSGRMAFQEMAKWKAGGIPISWSGILNSHPVSGSAFLLSTHKNSGTQLHEWPPPGGFMGHYVHYRLYREEVSRLIDSEKLKLWWVAEYTGVHKTTLRRWLQGKIQLIRQDHIYRLAEVLKTTPVAIAEPVILHRIQRTTGVMYA